MIVDCLSIAEDKIKSEFQQQAILESITLLYPNLLDSKKLYMGITTSKFSALSIFSPLSFEMKLLNGAFF